MAQKQNLSTVQKIQDLWLSLNRELSNMFDAHFVCAAVASEVAVHTATTTIVGISDPQRKFFDVWICQADGKMKQDRWEREKASFAPFIDAEKAIYIEKFDRPVAELIQSELWLHPHDAIFGVPIPFPATPLAISSPGVLCLVDPGEACFLNSLDLERLAAIITIFLDRAYLRHQVDRQEVEFAVISDISHTLTSTLSLENVFNQLSGTIRRTLNVESLSVGLREEITGDIIFVDFLMGPLFDQMPSIRLKKGQGVAGWVAENSEPVIINDTYADKRFYSRVDRQSGFTTHSMICIPLKIEERTIGILQAINRVNGEFSQHDLRLLQAIGGPLAAAIENSRLHMNVLAEKRRIETIFAGMSEGMLTLNSEYRVTNANEAMGALLQKDPPKLLGKQIENIVKLQKGDMTNFIGRIGHDEDENPQIVGDVLRDNGETVPIMISGAAVTDNNNLINEYILAFSDLTQIREVERMRDDFFQGIVHELRTPLATILMYARLLREGKARDEEKAVRFLGVIERESDRLQKMVRQMLLLAKQEARELHRSPEPVALNPLFTEILPPFADQANEKGLTFIQRVASELPFVMGDVDTIELIFKNLIENALKYTPSGSVRINAKAVNESVQVKIADDGIGIPHQAMPNLFKRFYRTQTAVERGIAGTGLGLYMVKENVENLGGSIQVESSEGKGSTFTVSFPAVQG